MDFQCFKCERQSHDIKVIIKHLKNANDYKIIKEKIKCIVKNSKCGKSFINFDSLQKHIGICSQNASELFEVSALHFH